MPQLIANVVIHLWKYHDIWIASINRLQSVPLSLSKAVTFQSNSRIISILIPSCSASPKYAPRSFTRVFIKPLLSPACRYAYSLAGLRIYSMNRRIRNGINARTYGAKVLSPRHSVPYSCAYTFRVTYGRTIWPESR